MDSTVCWLPILYTSPSCFIIPRFPAEVEQGSALPSAYNFHPVNKCPVHILLTTVFFKMLCMLLVFRFRGPPIVVKWCLVLLNAGRLWRALWRKIWRASQVVVVRSNLPANTGDTRGMSLIPGLGRSPGGGNGNPLQYSCLGNSTSRGTWQATVHGCKESDMTEQWSTHTHTHTYICRGKSYKAVYMKQGIFNEKHKYIKQSYMFISWQKSCYQRLS